MGILKKHIMKLSILSLLGFLTTAAVGVVGSEINPLEPQIIADQVTNGEHKRQSDDESNSQLKSQSKMDVPPTLSMKEFDKLTREKLVLVEFFSPYCHHCKEFAPTWKETYIKFVTEYPDLNIEMKQVNCIESGDLCEREHIDFYPNILLYAPAVDKDGKKTGKLKNIDSFPRNLDRNVENIIKYLREATAEFDSGAINLPSSSQLLDVDTMSKIIDGNISTPMFVSFFPATKRQWESVEHRGRLGFSNCEDCLPAKQIWDRLSNKILSISNTGHFMCRDHREVCDKLKITSNNEPQFIMFLPESIGAVRFDYNDYVDVNRMKWWVQKLFQNSQFEVVSARGITEVMEYTKVLSHEPIAQFYPLKSKITVVFYYDIDKVTEEDEKILPHLLKTIQESPFNIQLHKGKHKKIEENVLTMGQNLIEYINYDENDKYEFDKSIQVLTTLTTKPTILVFKDNSLIADVYQSLSPEDMKTYDKVESFINSIQYPLYGQLTPQLAPYYFKNNEKYQDHKVVVLFTDLLDLKGTDNQLYKLSLAAHEYHHLKQKYYFDRFKQSNQVSAATVEKLQEQNQETIDALKELQQVIPELWENDQVLFTFIDLPNAYKQFRGVKGWRLNPNNYQVGDVVVLSKDNRYYWNKDTQGNKLTNEPKELKKVLMSLLAKDDKLKAAIVGSPYGGVLGFMDYVHDYGVWGYIGFFLSIYTAGFLVLRLGRRSSRRWLFKRPSSSTPSSGGGGIIGNNFTPKKD